jgi:multidrug transporter EmrE-like cation transporter
MAAAVYVLCGLTSGVCAWLLLRTYADTRVRLVLWSGLCFVGFAVNNFVLFIDKVVAPDVDLSAYRALTGLAAVAVLLFGLIWEGER